MAQAIDYWGVLKTGRQNVIVLVVDDSDDDMLAHLVASENTVSSPRFGGVWGSGQEDDHWLVAFQLVELGAGSHGVNRQWYTAYFDEQLLKAGLDVPHYVAILPAELAGGARTLEGILPRLQAALHVEVEDRAPQIEQVLAERVS